MSREVDQQFPELSYEPGRSTGTSIVFFDGLRLGFVRNPARRPRPPRVAGGPLRRQVPLVGGEPLMGRGANYIREGFYGLVMMKDWYHHADGSSYKVVVGRVTVLKDTELVGFEVQGNEANWVCRIESADGQVAVNVPGCQVRAVTACRRSDVSPHANELLVLA